jgi:hypothetical protein
LYTEAQALTWQDRRLVASGGGYQGPWQMNESMYDYVDDPAAAIDGTGSIGVVWADQARQDIFFPWSVGEEEAADIHFSKSLDQGLSFMAPKIAHQRVAERPVVVRKPDNAGGAKGP